MRMKYLKYSLILIGLFCCANTAHALTVSPPILDVAMDPGQEKQGVIKLFNEGDSELFLDGFVEIFKPKGERGEVELVEAGIASQAINWVTLPINSLSLAPGEVKEVPVVVSIPATADVGGYYLALMWQTNTAPKSENTQVSISGKVGTLLILDAGGAVNESVNLLDFSLTENKNLFSSLPIDFLFRLQNTGNVHVKPAGRLVVKNMFGRVSDTVPINPEMRNVLPQSIRLFDMVWGSDLKQADSFWGGLTNEWQSFKIGKYTVYLDLEYGRTNTSITSSTISFWILPWRTLSIILIVALFIILKIVAKRKKT